MDFPELEALNTEWRNAPPIRIVLAAYAGYEKPQDAQSGESQAEELMKLFPQAAVRL